MVCATWLSWRLAFASSEVWKHGSVIYSVGKVHGSLARAGKVKGQTPKVEKAEKKKQVTGKLHVHFIFILSMLDKLLCVVWLTFRPC